MKMVVVSDVQAHQWKKYPETNADGVNLRLLDTVNELERIRKLAVKNKVEYLAVLGDIFEARNALDTSVLNSVYYSFRAYAECGIKVLLLVGNHDRTGVGDEHALEVFKPFCTVIDRPSRIPLQKGNIVAVPFHPNPKSISRAIRELVTKDTKLLFLHCAVKGLKITPNRVWGEGISLEEIPKHVLCLLGHYHKFSELRPGKVWYLGSMIQVDRGDFAVEKYFAVYDSEAGEEPVRFVPTRGPRFVSIDIEFFSVDFFESLEPHVLGNFVMVRSIPRDWVDLQAIEVQLKKLGARHVEFAPSTALPATIPQEILHTAVEMPTVEILEQYVEESKTELEKDRVVTVGTDIVDRQARERELVARLEAERLAREAGETLEDTVDRGDPAIDREFELVTGERIVDVN